MLLDHNLKGETPFTTLCVDQEMQSFTSYHWHSFCLSYLILMPFIHLIHFITLLFLIHFVLFMPLVPLTTITPHNFCTFHAPCTLSSHTMVSFTPPTVSCSHHNSHTSYLQYLKQFHASSTPYTQKNNSKNTYIRAHRRKIYRSYCSPKLARWS